MYLFYVGTSQPQDPDTVLAQVVYEGSKAGDAIWTQMHIWQVCPRGAGGKPVYETQDVACVKNRGLEPPSGPECGPRVFVLERPEENLSVGSSPESVTYKCKAHGFTKADPIWVDSGWELDKRIAYSMIRTLSGIVPRLHPSDLQQEYVVPYSVSGVPSSFLFPNYSSGRA